MLLAIFLTNLFLIVAKCEEVMAPESNFPVEVSSNPSDAPNLKEDDDEPWPPQTF